MKKTYLYHIVDVSPWPLASSIGALLLTSGFACYIHRVFIFFKLYDFFIKVVYLWKMKNFEIKNNKLISQKRFYCNKYLFDISENLYVQDGGIFFYSGFLNDFLVIDENTKDLNNKQVLSNEFCGSYDVKTTLFIKFKKMVLTRQIDHKSDELLCFNSNKDYMYLIKNYNKLIKKNFKNQLEFAERKIFIIGRSSPAELFFYNDIERISDIFFSFNIINQINLKKNKISVYIFKDIIIVVVSKEGEHDYSLIEKEFILKNDVERSKNDWKFFIMNFFKNYKEV